MIGILEVEVIVRLPSGWQLPNDLLTYWTCLVTLHLVVSVIDQM